jgi:uncharacterized protein with PCYCGC motif
MRLASISFLLTSLFGTAFLLSVVARPQERRPESKVSTGRAQVATRPDANPGKEANPAPKHSYHGEPPTGPLPATLDAKQFASKEAFVAYSLAGQVKELLYQEPCYCTCDKQEGHKSLLDCYVFRHGAGCLICQKEVIITYEKSKLGWTAVEIRRAIEQGDVWQFDLDKRVEEHYEELLEHAPKKN